MSKSKEELNALKKEVEAVNEKLHELTPDELANVTGGQAAGPSSYGMTDTMGRMHSDAQFAGSSSAPAS